MGEKHKYGMQVTLGSFLLPTAINHINVWPHQQHPENAKKTGWKRRNNEGSLISAINF